MAKAGEGVEPLLFVGEDEAMDLGLRDKLAFVDGGTAGIGFAIATALARRRRARGRQRPAHAAGRRRSDRGDSVTDWGGRSCGYRRRSEPRKHGGSALPSPSRRRRFW